MEIKIGYSPCPNDCFIFDALVNNRIDTGGIHFVPVIKDVEELNLLASKGVLEITKLSYNAYGHFIDNYIMLNSGSALGRGCGPLVIARQETDDSITENPDTRISLPGKYTTANLLFTLRYPGLKNKLHEIFSEIENSVATMKSDLGVIIHENRFTYHLKGLKKIIDLGEWWESTTSMPIPLGGISGRRDMPVELLVKIDKLIQQSIQYAFANPHESKQYVKQHAQEMDDDVILKHINTYVNNFSIELGDEGRLAVHTLFNFAARAGIHNTSQKELFV